MTFNLRKPRNILPTAAESGTLSEKTSKREPDAPRDEPTPIELDTTLILEKANAHREYICRNRRRVKCHNLPEFEQLHNVSSDEAEKQLHDEIERLKAVANKPENETFTWRSEIQSDACSNVSPQILEEVLDHLVCNIDILNFKNALIVVENLRFCHWESDAKLPFSRALQQLRSSRESLVSRFVPSCNFINVTEPQKLAPGTVAYGLYDDLINYATACIYRYIIHAADGIAWTHTTLAVLARISRKLKDLKHNARQCADECIAGAEFLHDDLKDENSDQRKRYLFCIGEADPIDILDDTEFIRHYFVEQSQFRVSLCNILYNVCTSLWSNIDSRNTTSLRDNLDDSTLVQGTQGEQALVMSSRDEDLSISNNDLIMLFAYNGCQLFLPLARSLASDKTRPHNRKDAVILRWRWGDPPHSERDMAYVEGVDEIITTIIHLTLTSSMTARCLGVLASFILALPGEENNLDLDFPPGSCRVAFNLQTVTRPRTLPDEEDRTSLMTFTAYALSQQIAVTPSIAAATQGPGATLREAYHRNAEPKIREWVIDCETIVIRCPWVVLSIILPSITIAAAGIALLLAPYHKPANVDPSNFMIFLWSIALSFLLVAKAFYVPDWPWHDFLRGEVCCRSVSEVSRITGIDRQLVLVHCLSHEHKHALRVKGPYAKLFTQYRRAETSDITPAMMALKDSAGSQLSDDSRSDGFSIDVPITLEAVYASGILIIKVTDFEGPKLVFVDGRQGSSHDIGVGNATRNHLTATLNNVGGSGKGPTKFISSSRTSADGENLTSEGGGIRRRNRKRSQRNETPADATAAGSTAAGIGPRGAGEGGLMNMQLVAKSIGWQHVNVSGLFVDKRASFL